MEEIKRVINKQRRFFLTGKSKSIDYRKEQLKRLRNSIIKHEQDILNALRLDLNKPPFEAYATEIGMVLSEISLTLKKLNKWATPKKVNSPLVNMLSYGRVYPEPYGVVLIISPWNYPFQLAMEPLIGAIAAGNCITIKPSNYSTYTSGIIEMIIKETFQEAYISVIQGGREANSTLLEQKFDYIFFTGSTAVGKIVMEAASKHLTPITLELGGKSPCIVDQTADLALAAKRIIWGKFINAGQTCVAPDYLLVHRSVKAELLERMKDCVFQFYGKQEEIKEDFPKIINRKHFDRLVELIQGEELVVGGHVMESTHQIAPTIIDHVTWDSPLMEDEIFGPLLPVLEYEDLNDTINNIISRPKPLALYLFTTDQKTAHKVIRNISFGGGCINETVMHLASPNMPFGGVGESGMGRYHGKASFDTFSHMKSILYKSNRMDIPLRYPPYHNRVELIKKLMK